MKTILTFILNTFSSLNPAVSAVVAVCTVMLGINGYVKALWSDVFARAGTLSAGTFAGVDLSGLSAANQILPLDVFCTLATSYMALLLVCTSIRIVKSWIPTVS